MKTFPIIVALFMLLFTLSCKKEQTSGTQETAASFGTKPSLAALARTLPSVPEVIHFDVIHHPDKSITLTANITTLQVRLDNGQEGTAFLVRVTNPNVEPPADRPTVTCESTTGWFFDPQATNCLIYGTFTECSDGWWHFSHHSNSGLDYCIWETIGGIDFPGHLAKIDNFLKHGYFC